MKDFIDFIRKQGVVGLAVGFILGGAVSKLVSALVTDLINPLIGLIWGSSKGLADAGFMIGSAKFMYGDFISALIDFIIVAFVVYFGFKALKLEQLDKKE
ncbi:MAG: MscL family protein [Candidatus Komeilibacteria bacterium]